MVEYAIVFPLQLFITFGVMQLALIYIAGLATDYAAFRACRAYIVGEGYYDADPGRLDRVAGLMLAPLAGGSFTGAATEEPTEIPGWGTIHNSDMAASKVCVHRVELPGDEDNGVITVAVEFNYQLIFPAMDMIFRIFSDPGGAWSDESMTVFGELEEGAPDIKAPVYDGSPESLPETPLVRMIGGAPHLLIIRKCSMYGGIAKDLSEDGIVPPEL